jgi:hypothetical protein
MNVTGRTGTWWNNIEYPTYIPTYRWFQTLMNAMEIEQTKKERSDASLMECKIVFAD